jgi:type III secretory pathway component EscR
MYHLTQIPHKRSLKMLASLLAVFIMTPIHYQMCYDNQYPDESVPCNTCEIIKLSDELVDQIDNETRNLFLSGYMAYVDRDFEKMDEMIEYIEQNVQLLKITDEVIREWQEAQRAK